eukprot:scaffold20461_cov117-Cylindrotheca_fusiformis.AAC.6
MANDFSSEVFKPSGSSGAISPPASAALRVKSKSSELKLVPRSSNLQKNNSILSELTINKLNIKAMGLIGREREIESISTQSLNQSDVPKELVFITSGYSGVGKSSLAKTLKDDVIGRTAGGIYVEGKFDSNANDEPYLGVASAFGQMCRRILDRQDKSRKNGHPSRFGSPLLVAALGRATNLLSNLIPELQDVLPVMRRNSDNSGVFTDCPCVR